MEEAKKAAISMEQLLEDGWVKTDDDVFIVEKKITNENPINNSEDSEIRLVVHGMYNKWVFAIVLPDGGMLNFWANSMKQLKEFENHISFYDPPF
jgi:hypothetical protein